MTKFADQLYDDLMRRHGATLAQTSPPAPSRRPITSRGALVATGAGGLAAAATAGFLVTGGSAPAYALTTNHDKTVTLAVYQLSGIAQANAKLHQLGDNVVVVPVRPGCPSVSSLPKPTVHRPGKLNVMGSAKSKDGAITVQAQGVPAGDILVVGAQVTAHGTRMGAVLTVRPAPSCVSLPPAPGGPSVPSLPGGSGPNVGHRSGGSGPALHSSGSGSHVVRAGAGSNVSGKN
jgi:hypothetical protein